MKKRMGLKKNEKGMVAIVVTVFFMIILTLIVLAFSQTARREQRQSLDNQLQKQAFYAAESGINDTKRKIDDGTYSTAQKTDCYTGGDTVNLTEDGSISYSCVLYDKTPGTVRFDNVGTSQGEVVSLKTSSGTLEQVLLSWRDTSGNSTTTYTDCPASTAVTTFAAALPANCSAGIIKVVIMPLMGDSSRDKLVSDSFTVFFRPVSTDAVTGEVSYSRYDTGSPTGYQQGQVISAKCTADNRCTAKITGLPNNPNTENFIYIRSIDKSNAIDIDGTLYGGTKALYSGAQILIDVTGKANDVIRRLQVRKPINPEYLKPPFAIEVLDGICKKLEVTPQQTNDPYEECYPAVPNTSPDYKGPSGIN